MALRLRAIIQTAVNGVRGVKHDIAARHVADLAVLRRVPALYESALVLRDGGIAPDPKLSAEIAERVRAAVAGVSNVDLRGDLSALDRITDSLSRGICLRQMGLITRLHLIASVARGVEDGLRDLVATPIDPRLPRETLHVPESVGPQAPPKPSGTTKKAASAAPGALKRAVNAETSPAAGTKSIHVDTPDL